MSDPKHPGPARDVDLAGWLDGVGFHPADTELKQRGHEAARLLVALLATHLHDLLPAGRDKRLVFTHLEDVLIRSNRALALGKGPRDGVTLDPSPSSAGLRVLIDDLKRILAELDSVVPYDPRISQYEQEQRGGQAADPLPPFEYRRGAESGMVRTLGIGLTGTGSGTPEVKIQVAEHDEGENFSEDAEVLIDNPEVLEEASSYLLSVAGRLRALQAR